MASVRGVYLRPGWCDRDREDAKASFGHLRVSLGDVIRGVHTQRQDAFERAFDVDAAVGPLDGHPLQHRIERCNRDARVHPLDVTAIDPAFGCRHQDRDFERLPDVAAELVRLNIDVLVAVTTNAALAAKKSAGSVPIIFMGVTDPIAAGLVESLARPGGNSTGITNMAA